MQTHSAKILASKFGLLALTTTQALYLCALPPRSTVVTVVIRYHIIQLSSYFGSCSGPLLLSLGSGHKSGDYIIQYLHAPSYIEFAACEAWHDMGNCPTCTLRHKPELQLFALFDLGLQLRSHTARVHSRNPSKNTKTGFIVFPELMCVFRTRKTCKYDKAWCRHPTAW